MSPTAARARCVPQDAITVGGVTIRTAKAVALRGRWCFTACPHQGRKAFTLQTAPAATDAIDGDLARAAGFSMHAGVACEAHEREKLERLCRYILISRATTACSRRSIDCVNK